MGNEHGFHYCYLVTPQIVPLNENDTTSSKLFVSSNEKMFLQG